MNFINDFIFLKNRYETKERNPEEIKTYELLEKMIEVYGYNSVCNELSFNKRKNKTKNNELSIFMNEVKKNIPLEILCSQLFYLDNSLIITSGIKKLKSKNKNNVSNNNNNNNKFKVKK